MAQSVDEILSSTGSALESTYDNIEGVVFDSMGLDTPTKRLLFTGVGTTAILWAAKPSTFFTQSGTPRSWSYTNPGDKNSTATPWWLVAGGAGLLFSTVL